MLAHCPHRLHSSLPKTDFTTSTRTIMPEESPPHSEEIQSTADAAASTFPLGPSLANAALRTQVEERLKGRLFTGIVINVLDIVNGFVRTDDLPDDVFCHYSVWPEDSSLMVPGRKVEFKAGLRFHDKKVVWNYVVTKLRVLDPGSLPESMESASYEKSSMGNPPDCYVAPTASSKGDDAIQCTQQQLGSPSASSPLVQAEKKTAPRNHQLLHPTAKPRPKYYPTFLQPAARRLKGDPFGHLKSVAFSNEKDTDLVIYIDEAWPAEGTDAEFGVLAGVVWIGPAPDLDILPIPPQHLREHDDFHQKALGYLKRLDDCPNAIPFIFRFKPPGKLSPTEAYEQMVHEGLLILLGWLLPVQAPTLNQPTGVRVVCEAIGADHRDGRDQTDIFRGVLAQAARRDPARFSRWVLTELVWVQKSGADPATFSPREILYQGYMAYGDLLGYMTVGAQSPKALRLAREVRLDQFPNFLTISPGLANTLEMIHQIGPANPGVFLDQMAANLESPFIRGILDELRKRWDTDADAKLKLYGELDARYMQKVRDLRGLARQFDVLQRICGPLPPDAPRRLRLMEIGIQLQRANHFGDPASLGALEQFYQELRRRALDNGEADLVAHVDLNLAVRAADRFEPEQAKVIVEDLIKEESRLSLLSRARAHSALGQYLSMTADYESARREFDLALDLIGKADLSESDRLGDWDQTAIYRAFNAIDSCAPDTRSLVEEVIQRGGLGNERRNQFRHHLLVRFLDSRDELAPERKIYMESAAHDLLDTHPWQIIAMYRGLFASELGRDEEAVRYFDQALQIALGSLHGPTLRMIAAVIATVAWLETDEPAFKEAALGIMDGEWKDLVPPQPLTEILPTTTVNVKRLRELLAEKPEEEGIDKALGLLSFNYR
jgi:tetratricopeptide (TPR) repeat protein